jgi:ferredoxin
MRIAIDAALCTGHARCVSLVPELFVDDENGYGQVIGDGTVSDDRREMAVRAISACPERAISLIEE